jgi:hypothetical protein
MQGEVKGLHAKWMLTKSVLTIAKANWNLGSQESCNPGTRFRFADSRITGFQDSRLPNNILTPN